jgi:hypothetical protein
LFHNAARKVAGRWTAPVLGAAFLFLAAPPVFAQRGVIGIGATTSGGVRNVPGIGGQSSTMAFGAVNPSITLSTGGPRTAFNAAYMFGLDRGGQNSTGNSYSHSVSMGLSKTLSPRWKAGLSGSHLTTSNPSVFFALVGIVPERNLMVFSPVAVNLQTTNNSAQANLSYSRNERSSYSFSVTHSLRNYGSGVNGLGGTLSNQQSVGLQGILSQRSSERDTWTLNYGGEYQMFNSFGSTQTHGMSLGFSRALTPRVNLNVSAGASTVAGGGVASGYTTYNSSARLERSLPRNTMALYFSRDAGRSSGLGSVADTRRAGFNLGQTFRTLTTFVDASVFDTQDRSVNANNVKGASFVASLGSPISRSMQLRVSTQFQRYNASSAVLGFTEKRIFLSLSYSNPALWRL